MYNVRDCGHKLLYCSNLCIWLHVGKPMYKECYLKSGGSWLTGFSLEILRIKNIKKNMQLKGLQYKSFKTKGLNA